MYVYGAHGNRKL